jgi:hypothetical protein
VDVADADLGFEEAQSGDTKPQRHEEDGWTRGRSGKVAATSVAGWGWRSPCIATYAPRNGACLSAAIAVVGAWQAPFLVPFR